MVSCLFFPAEGIKKSWAGEKVAMPIDFLFEKNWRFVYKRISGRNITFAEEINE